MTPIFKSGERNDENNYRPISVLPLVSKVMERAVQAQFLAFLNVRDLLSVNQSGFHKKHSTETAIVYLTDYILDHMDRQMSTGAVFIDLKKAFDLVDHECLLYKLEHYGVRESSFDWFRNYLMTRTQRVFFGKHLSSCRPIQFGVPQGSILGPLLFVLYINDLPQCLENCSIHMYADDTVLYFTSLCSSEINKVVQDDLNQVAKWIERNKLILNHSKTKTMLFGSRQNLSKSPHLCIQLHGKILEKVPKFNYLGVFLDETLSWRDHVEYVSSKVSSRLGLLSRIRACLALEASKQVYTSIVQPLFDYADAAWGEISEGCCKELQHLQNRAARIILRRKTSKNAFHLLNWLSLACRRKLHKCRCVLSISSQW